MRILADFLRDETAENVFALRNMAIKSTLTPRHRDEITLARDFNDPGLIQECFA